MLENSQLFDGVYQQLKRTAEAMVTAGAPLRPTELVHEAWARLESHEFQGSTHYRTVAAMAMRQILCDHARSMSAKKRTPVAVTLADASDGLSQFDIVALHIALEHLESLDPRGYRVVCLRYLGGMTTEEAAAELDVSVRTIQSVWRITRAWLVEQIT